MEYLWILGSITMINIILSGDNALVIALASRNLPPEHKRLAILLGTGGAIVMRAILSVIAVYLLNIPYLQIVGGIMLLWIAIKLIADDHANEGEIEAKSNLWGAVQTIIVADLVMSLDNVVAIAGVARGNLTLILIGLVISIPIIIWGSQLISAMMKKWPIIIIIGAAILGWTAGEMMLADQKAAPLLGAYTWTSWAVPVSLAVFVIAVGLWIARGNKVTEQGGS
ncbi:MAG TPA: TerC family protein [Selenomonadales bacterium]|nr:TerC family protein [Selenomonadales bacterium]